MIATIPTIVIRDRRAVGSTECVSLERLHIQSGAFAERFIGDQDNGGVEFLSLREKEAGHPIEATGKALRSHFSWKQADDDYTEGSAAR